MTAWKRHVEAQDQSGLTAAEYCSPPGKMGTENAHSSGFALELNGLLQILSKAAAIQRSQDLAPWSSPGKMDTEHVHLSGFVLELNW